jgi:UDP-glucose 4-epimerase
MRTTILITGGAGYIGSHIAHLLVDLDYQVVVVDTKLPDPLWSHAHISLVKADIADKGTLASIFTTYNITMVIHTAAFIEVGRSTQEPALFYDNNIARGLALIDTMLLYGVKTLIFSSSCAVYGAPEKLPIAETHPKNPMSPYGKTKLMFELILEDYAQAYGLRFVNLRYFNVAGAWPERNLGEHHEPETHIVPLLLRAARDASLFLLFGTDHHTPDGTCIRDYVHVRDIAFAHAKAIAYLNAGNSSQSFNIGSGNGTSIRKLINVVEHVAGSPVGINQRARRAGDPAILVADISKAREMLGWEPHYSHLETMVSSAYHYAQHQHKTYARSHTELIV